LNKLNNQKGKKTGVAPYGGRVEKGNQERGWTEEGKSHANFEKSSGGEDDLVLRKGKGRAKKKESGEPGASTGLPKGGVF